MNGGHVTETISLWESFLSRDAMRKRGLCRHAVCVCLFVRPSVRPSRSCILILSKGVNMSFFLSLLKVFSSSGSHTILVFPYQILTTFRRGPPVEWFFLNVKIVQTIRPSWACSWTRFQMLTVLVDAIPHFCTDKCKIWQGSVWSSMPNFVLSVQHVAPERRITDFATKIE